MIYLYLNLSAGRRRPVVIGDMSDAPTSVLMIIGQVVVNISVTATGIVQRPCIVPPMLSRRVTLQEFFLTDVKAITGGKSDKHRTVFIDHPTMLNR